jgi:energy-coupling factor transporter ATP-binding protein EcfA2
MSRTPAAPITTLPRENKKNICIIGPRASGKTTFLGALLSITNHSNNKSHGGKVTVDTKGLSSQLESKVRDSWETKRPLGPTTFDGGLQNYEFSITINPQYKPTEIELKAKDYPGEFFQELLRTDLSTTVKSYILDCLINPNGWIVLLPDFCLQDEGNEFTIVENIDSFYRSVFHKLLSEFPKNDHLFSSDELTKIQNNLRKMRIAFVMSKCERGELWTRRWEPERDLFQVHLSNTRDFLRNNLSLGKNQISFFALSSFGVFSKKDHRPNRLNLGRNVQDGATMGNKQAWKPFGLVNPLYWIATGRKWKDPSF